LFPLFFDGLLLHAFSLNVLNALMDQACIRLLTGDRTAPIVVEEEEVTLEEASLTPTTYYYLLEPGGQQ